VGIAVEAFNKGYVGLPTVVDRITSSIFYHLGEIIRSKLQGGIGKGGFVRRERDFLKVVIQFIPLYTMCCFLLSNKVCKQLISDMARGTGGAAQLIADLCIGSRGSILQRQKVKKE
jgi:hypothetical protein